MIQRYQCSPSVLEIQFLKVNLWKALLRVSLAFAQEFVAELLFLCITVLGYYFRTSLTAYMLHVLLGRYQLNSFPVYLVLWIHRLCKACLNFPLAPIVVLAHLFVYLFYYSNIPRICFTCMTSPYWVGMVTCWEKGNYWSWRHDVGVVVNSRVGDALVG
jgi:hypothetical protein